MKNTKNLTTEAYKDDRIYVLWDNVRSEQGVVLDSQNEVQEFIDNILFNNEGFEEMESDKAVASHYNYDNCIILGKDAF